MNEGTTVTGTDNGQWAGVTKDSFSYTFMSLVLAGYVIREVAGSCYQTQTDHTNIWPQPGGRRWLWIATWSIQSVPQAQKNSGPKVMPVLTVISSSAAQLVMVATTLSWVVLSSGFSWGHFEPWNHTSRDMKITHAVAGVGHMLEGLHQHGATELSVFVNVFSVYIR